MNTTEWKWKTNDSLEIYSKAWLPSGKAKGVVCLVHGVGEHIGRYQADGEALTLMLKYALHYQELVKEGQIPWNDWQNTSRKDA